MLELCKEYYEFNEHCQMLTLEFLRKFVAQVKKNNNITFGIKGVKEKKLEEGWNAGYSFDDMMIYICFENVKEILEEDMETKFDIYNAKHIKKFNESLIYNMSHECYHGLQAEYLKKNGERTLQAKLFADSLNDRFYKKISYLDCYYFVPIETNATIQGLLYEANFINSLDSKENVEDNNAIIAKRILELFLDEECNYIIPTEIFYRMTNRIKRYKDIIGTRNVDSYRKLILGLDIEQEYVDKLLSLAHKKTKTDDIKIYLKSK